MPNPIAGLSFMHLIALAIAASLAASGAVPTPDLAFPLLHLPYAFLLSRLAFPRDPSTPRPPPVFPRGSRPFVAYTLTGGVVGFLLPALYVLRGAVVDGLSGTRAAAPPLFLLASQLFAEGVAYSRGFSLPAFAAVPILSNAYRLRAIGLWVGEEQGLAGRALAMANLAFWLFNLFGLLVPIFLPRVMKIYYQHEVNKEE